MMRPAIGIVLDWQATGSFSPRSHYAIRDSYFAAVYDAGGLPIGLPLLESAVTEYLPRIQGVVIPGGDYPSPSRWYADGHGIPDEHPRTVVNENLVRELLKTKIPLLAICAGHQELAAATGGLLHWRVAQAVPGATNHRSTSPTEVAHAVQVTPGTLLHRLVGAEVIHVNSHHNEAVKSLGAGVVVSGLAPDGVIEAIEVPAHPFALGVQWHPEFGLTESDHALFIGLVAAAKARL